MYNDDQLRSMEQLLILAITLRRKDMLIRQAYRLGIPKCEIHRITGVARTTIDRIIENGT